jgi:hypothetical protein
MSQGNVAYFRFQPFADAPTAQSAFEAAYPLGSPIEPALEALVSTGAHCRSVGPNKFACRYIETEAALAGFCWHVALECNSEKAIQRVGISVALLGL